MALVALILVAALAVDTNSFLLHYSAKSRNSYALSLSSVGMNEVVNTPPALVKVNPTAHDKYTGRDPARVKIFDTTLRDGEQSPGCTMNTAEKLQVAKQLARLGVDVIEAGFPVASVGDFEAVEKIAKSVGQLKDPPIICGLSRALKNDISVCYDAIKGAKFPRIHTFIATSDIHMEHKLKKSREQVLDITTEMVSHAKSLCDDIEFSAEDALRSDPEFLYEVYSRAIEAGATTLNVPDTVGYTTPAEFFSLIKGIRGNVRGIDDVTISAHGHNDLGMAVANFLSAIEGGARQMECTINGIGERAGNAALEELVMSLHVRKAYYNKFFGRSEEDETPLTNVRNIEIYKSSRLVSSITGMTVQANKAIVGANAFAHESGIHQDGVLKNKRTYEIMDAESIGLVQNNIVLGKHSGRHAFRSRLQELGFESISDDDLNRSFMRFKELADKKKDITNADIATATIIDTADNSEHVLSATGTGPIDAAFKCIRGMTHTKNIKLLEYTVSSVTAGIDALGEVTVRLEDRENKRVVFGRSSNTDVFVASGQAYINALNRIVSNREENAPVPTHSQFNSY